MRRDVVFREWFERHQGLIYKISRAYASTSEDMQDLLQEIMLQLWHSIPSFREQAKESTWIYRVALNTAMGWSRTERKHSRTRRRVLLMAVPSTPPDPGEDLEKEERLAKVYEVVRSLSPADASVVLLFLDGLSYEDMAEVLGITVSNVGVKLHRAKKRIAQLLGEERDDY